MFQFDNLAFFVHEKHAVVGCRFVSIQTDDDGKCYYISWEDLISVTETLAVKILWQDRTTNGSPRNWR